MSGTLKPTETQTAIAREYAARIAGRYTETDLIPRKLKAETALVLEAAVAISAAEKPQIDLAVAKAARTSMQRIRMEVVGLSDVSCATVERIIREEFAALKSAQEPPPLSGGASNDWYPA